MVKGLIKTLIKRLAVVRSVITSRTNGDVARYALASTVFDREFKVVRAGIRSYEASSAPRSLLRRDTHRLEKGLLMRPRRNIFALDYISELVEALASTVHGSDCDPEDPELAWVGDVLRGYFEVTGSHPIRDAAEEKFRSIERRLPKAGHRVPYLRELGNGPPVGYEQFLCLARQRRSVRWFKPDPVPRPLLEQAMDVAREAPSACNRQPFIFRTFDTQPMASRVAKVPMGTSGYADQIPCIIVVVGQLRNYFDERDRHLIYIDGALAGMSFAFAAETLGLSTCLINWPDIEQKERAMADLIGLEADERPVFLIAVGYPDPGGLVARSEKKSVAELLKFDAPS